MSGKEEIQLNLVRAENDSLLRRVCTENAYASADLAGLDLSNVRKSMNLDEIPSRWRLRAWQNLYSREFKRLFKNMQSDDKDLSDGSIKGLFESMKRHMKEKKPATIGEKENFDGLRSILDFLDTAVTKDSDLSERSLESAETFLKAEISSNLTFQEDRMMSRTDAEMVYLSLLRNADHIEQMDTVDEMYASMKKLMGHRIPHSIEAFRQICYRIGLVGQSTIRKRSH